jgi:hypothetical protein
VHPVSGSTGDGAASVRKIENQIVEKGRVFPSLNQPGTDIEHILAEDKFQRSEDAEAFYTDFGFIHAKLHPTPQLMTLQDWSNTR